MNGEREAQFWEDMRTAKEDDTISRQMALDKIAEYFGDLRIVVHHDMLQLIKALPSAQQEVDFDEWCIDCKEYDHEKHRCPRCNRVIRDVLSVFKTGKIVRCKDCKYHEDESPGMVYCPNQVGGWVSEDFYCADGERRDDERRT